MEGKASTKIRENKSDLPVLQSDHDYLFCVLLSPRTVARGVAISPTIRTYLLGHMDDLSIDLLTVPADRTICYDER